MTSATWGSAPEATASHAGALSDRWTVPPFSVLDTTVGTWQAARRRWLALGIQSELGRGLRPGGNYRSDWGACDPAPGSRDLMDGSGRSLARGAAPDARAFSRDLMRGEVAVAGVERGSRRAADPTTPAWDAPVAADVEAMGVSVFDPVLCHVAYHWWAPPGGTILDPFAGGSVRGIVAALLGHPYTGVDLSEAQVAANRAQAAAILPVHGPAAPVPTWHVGDSRTALAALPPADLVFTCPPYYDLEVYSDDPRDLSRAPDWGAFLVGYRAVIAAAADRLRDGRFMVLVVSEIRGKERSGAYHGLVPATISAAQDAGLAFYNEAILVNSPGSLPLRVQQQMLATRKLGRRHQNVLVFLKGTAPRGWGDSRSGPPDPQLLAWPDGLPSVTGGPGAAESVSVAPAAAPAPEAGAWPDGQQQAAGVVVGLAMVDDPPATEEEMEAFAAEALADRLALAAEEGVCPACQEIAHDPGCALVGDGRPVDGPALPSEPDPAAVEAAPGTWLHHGAYLRGGPAPATPEAIAAIMAAAPPVVDTSRLIRTSSGAVDPDTGEIVEPLALADTWTASRATANRYAPAVATLLGRLGNGQVAAGTAVADVHQGTDYTVGDTSWGVRVRKPGLPRPPALRDVTFRNQVASGAATEIDKLRAGGGPRWYLYAWGAEDGTLDDWVVLDMDTCRMLEAWQWGHLVRNADESGFLALPLDVLWRSHVIVASSRPVDAIARRAPR